VSRYLRYLGLFILVQVCILVSLALVGGRPETYLAASVDKSNRLRTAPSPRVVLVGDSELAFGIDSNLLANRLDGRYSPVNMGLHAGLGLSFMLNQARDGLRSGDVVVLSLTYTSLWSDNPANSTLWTVIRNQPHAWTFVPKNERWRLLGHLIDEPVLIANEFSNIAFNKLYATIFGNETETVYSRRRFNAYGDLDAWNLTSKYSATPVEPLDDALPLANLNETIVLVQGFCAECSAKGISVLYAFSPVSEDWYQARRSVIARTAQMLESRLLIPFANTPEEAVFRSDSFYDGPFHLCGAAVEVNTDRLSSGLRRSIDSLAD
jgi:hypothetical protein